MNNPQCNHGIHLGQRCAKCLCEDGAFVEAVKEIMRWSSRTCPEPVPIKSTGQQMAEKVMTAFGTSGGESIQLGNMRGSWVSVQIDRSCSAKDFYSRAIPILAAAFDKAIKEEREECANLIENLEDPYGAPLPLRDRHASVIRGRK